MWKAILLLAFVDLTTGDKASFDNYKLYYLVPQTEEQLNFLNKLNNVSAFDWVYYWKSPTTVGSAVEIMVPPNLNKIFKIAMEGENMFSTRMISNIQPLINWESTKNPFKNNFIHYLSLDQIYKFLNDLSKEFPSMVQVIVGGKTYERRKIKGVKISFKPNNPGVFIEGGINSREWLSPAVVLYIIESLINNRRKDVRNMAESYDWYIFPTFNPDGYEYTHTTNRMWRKTRKPYFKSCVGADPNKNWDYKWNIGNASISACSDAYPGSEPFSEIETKSMSEFIESIQDKFFAYFSFHSYSAEVIYPSANDLKNDNDMVAIAKKGIVAPYWKFRPDINEIKHYYSRKIVVKTSNFTSGSSVDYIKGRYHKPLVLAYGLLDVNSSDGFLQPPENIIPTGMEIVTSLVAMLNEAKSRFLFNLLY